MAEIDVYFWTTRNGYKVTILLEELGWNRKKPLGEAWDVLFGGTQFKKR